MRNQIISLSVLIATLTIADTHIPAGTVNGVWDSTGSPYYIDGTVHVPTGSILRIQPGCYIAFTGYYKLYVDSMAILKAIGSEYDSIVFTVLDTTIGYHHGIRFFYSAEGCTLSYCRIEYGKSFGYGEDDNDGGGIYCFYSSPTIVNSTITGNSTRNDGGGGGIYCRSSSPNIRNNTLAKNSTIDDGHGGCIFCIDSSPIITNNIIIENSAANDGGGIYCAESSPIITNNIIIENSAANDGGGIYCAESSPIITNNNIIGNSAGSGGAAIYCNDSSSAIINNNTITENSAGGQGGGIFCNNFSSVIINNNNIAENSAAGDGGGIYCITSSPNISNNTIMQNSGWFGGGISCYNSSPNITNNIVTENSASGSGGGIRCGNASPNITGNTISGNSAVSWLACGGGISCASSSPKIANNIISGNNTDAAGGGIWCYQSSPTIANNTITGNSSSGAGGIYCNNNSDIILLNTIIWNNPTDTGHELAIVGYFWEDSPYCSVFVAYTDIDSSSCYIEPEKGIIIWGEGNINAAPFFADTVFHLSDSSLCIDGGANFVVTPWSDTVWAPDTDFEGGYRPFGAGFDIGADEYGTGIIYETKRKPESLSLLLYPNPFNSACRISAPEGAEMEIFDINGRCITEFGGGDQIWKPEASVGSGVYLVRAKIGDKDITKRVVYLK